VCDYAAHHDFLKCSGDQVFLTAGNLVHHLITRGLLSCDEVVDGSFVVVEAGRRNRNFKVMRSAGGLFVKQIRSVSPEAIATLQREADFYKLLQSQPHTDNLRSVIPPLLDYDPATCSLAVELVPDGEDLSEYHHRLREFPETAAELTGKALGVFHSEAVPLLREPRVLQVVPRELPWIFTLDAHTLWPLTTMGEPGYHLLSMLRAMPDLLNLLVSLQHEWQDNTLIHGDMKWENCVVFGESNERIALRLVDWEIAGVGDAAWDVGAIFASYLLHLIFAVQPSGNSQSMLHSQGMLQRMRPALAAFWREYGITRGLKQSLSAYYLVRTIRFCAARLVTAAFEYMFNAGQSRAYALAMLQAARNIFLDPVSAATQIAGEEARA